MVYDLYYTILQNGLKTALIYACENRHVQIVRQLLNRGAKVSTMNKVGLWIVAVYGGTLWEEASFNSLIILGLFAVVV